MKTALIAGVLALASATAAVADENRGFYLDAQVGQSKYDISQDELDGVAFAAFAGNGVVVLDSDSTFDDKDTAWALSGGYRFSPYLAVEVGYVDLGSTRYRSVSPVFFPGLGVTNATLEVDISAKGPTVAAIGALPLGQHFDVHGHLGVFFSETTLGIGVRFGNSGDSEELSANSQDVFAGLGAAYHVTSKVALSLDYSAFKKVGDEEKTGEIDVAALHLGVQYTF